MRLDIDFAFEVGDQEKHQVAFHWGQFRGLLRVTVDGVEVVAHNRPAMLASTARRKFAFSVGQHEVHEVVIEKISHRFLGGARKQKCQTFVDGKLVGEYAAGAYRPHAAAWNEPDLAS
jgi:hypothetical protein